MKEVRVGFRFIVKVRVGIEDRVRTRMRVRIRVGVRVRCGCIKNVAAMRETANFSSTLAARLLKMDLGYGYS